MTQFCSCPATFGNTGKPDCEPLQRVAKKLIFVNKFDSSGVRNSIASGQAVDDTFLIGKINETDETKRWFVSDEINTVTDERADKITQSIDNIDFNTDEGARVFTAFMNQGYTSLSKYKKGECVQNLAVYIVDSANKLLGEVSADGLSLYPIAIQNGTYSVKPVPATVSTISQNQIKFTFSQLVNDGNLRSLTAEADILNAAGLLDVNASVSSITTTGFVAVLTTDYGQFGNNSSVTGWDETFFDLYNVTQAATIVITSVTEQPNGTYTFVIPAATSADVLTLTQANPVADGYELTQTITIP